MNFRRLLAEKEIRENKRYSIKEVAEGAGLSRAGVYPWLDGTVRSVRLDTLEAICRFLECQPGDLLTLSDGEQVEAESA